MLPLRTFCRKAGAATSPPQVAANVKQVSPRSAAVWVGNAVAKRISTRLRKMRAKCAVRGVHRNVNAVKMEQTNANDKWRVARVRI